MFKTLYEFLTGPYPDPVYGTEVYPFVGLFTFLLALIVAIVFYIVLGRWKPVWDKLAHWAITLVIIVVVAFYLALSQSKSATGEDADSFMYKFSFVNALYAAIYFIIFSMLMRKASIFARRTPF